MKADLYIIDTNDDLNTGEMVWPKELSYFSINCIKNIEEKNDKFNLLTYGVQIFEYSVDITSISIKHKRGVNVQCFYGIYKDKNKKKLIPVPNGVFQYFLYRPPMMLEYLFKNIQQKEHINLLGYHIWKRGMKNKFRSVSSVHVIKVFLITDTIDASLNYISALLSKSFKYIHDLEKKETTYYVFQ